MVDLILRQPSFYGSNSEATTTYLKLSALQLFFCSLQSGGNLVIWLLISFCGDRESGEHV